jgi:cytochrome c
MKAHSLIASFVALLMLATAAQAQGRNPISHGRALVKEFCARCHAIGKRGSSPHSDAPPLRTIGRTFDLDRFPRVLIRGISSNHPDMPEFKFSPRDARAVRDYLRTIQESVVYGAWMAATRLRLHGKLRRV